MLVDLARNDIGRFCKADSITIPELMQVEPYSHVMHLTSEVRGKLRDGVHPLDACLGSLPAGTLSGAPKVRALQIISELEKSRRGPYGGAFGWMTDQAIDTCIFIRSAMLHEGTLYWQSGSGIVADSDPESEYQESLAKARAIEIALTKIGKHWKSHE
jgi:anthranilate synthase component 1